MTENIHVESVQQTDDGPFTFKIFVGQLRALIEPDRLGDVNSVVTLMNGDRRIRSVLTRVPDQATIVVGYDPGQFYPWLSGPGWRTMNGMPELEDPAKSKFPSWYIEIDGIRVLDVPEHETYPPLPPKPRVPLHQRARKHARAWANRLAERFGYHHEDDCGGDW